LNIALICRHIELAPDLCRRALGSRQKLNEFASTTSYPSAILDITETAARRI
jgi:hypothetical protein